MLRRRLLCLLLATVLTVVGIAWRTAPLHLPHFWFKYGGSFLWGAMLYFAVAAILPRLSPAAAARATAVLAALVEASRLYHSPSLDTFRATLAGRLLLGQHFALTNILAYWLGLATSFTLDSKLMTHPSRLKP